jgi:hypothetical protein
MYKQSWNLLIDNKPAVVTGLIESNIMMDYERHDESIFTEHGQEDMLDCWLFEGCDHVAGSTESCSLVTSECFNGTPYITWSDGVESDETVLKTFDVTVVSIEDLSPAE